MKQSELAVRRDGGSEIPRWRVIANIVEADWFQYLISGAIVLNAVVLGLETYSSIQEQFGETLLIVNEVLYFVFLIELIMRILSYGKRPWNFLRSGWNIFDLIVIGGALIPGLREQATMLRLLRLARVVRLMRYLPDARVLIVTLGKAIPSVFSMVVLVLLIMFIYGVLGWSMFGDVLPDSWGNIGTAMLTLFVLLTLENFPVYLQEAQPYSSFATLFFLSYVLIAVFVVINLLIGIVIGAMEKARDEEADRLRREEADEHTTLMDHVIAMRKQLDQIESEVESIRMQPGPRPGD